MNKIAIDVRTANKGIVSGISRFVVGLTTALASELSHSQNSPALKIILVLNSPPPKWVEDLVQKYPNLVSFLQYGERLPRKPIWLWSTFAFRKIQSLTDDQSIWIAPANFDRPLFLSQKNSSKVIQIIHDTIPFQKETGTGFLFRNQFQYFVKRALNELPHVATVSQHSAKQLQAFAAQRTTPLHIISDAIDPEFGNDPKITDKQMLLSQKKIAICEIAETASERELEEYVENKILPAAWVLGVGRNQKYKSWDTTLKAIQKLHFEENRNVWFFRVGADLNELTSYTQKCMPRKLGEIHIFDQLRVVVLPVLSDTHLVKLYRISQLFVHPSHAEGFGLSTLEAAFCGTPVLFQTGTAVDDHFLPNALPQNYWHGIDSDSAQTWAAHIKKMLDDEKDSEFFNKLNHAASTRQFIIEYSKCKKFEWKESANSLIEFMLKHEN